MIEKHIGTLSTYHWEPGDTEPVKLGHVTSLVVTVDGGAATLLGRNDDAGQWHPMADVHGFQIKAPGIYHVTMIPWSVRPEGQGAVTIVARG